MDVAYTTDVEEVVQDGLRQLGATHHRRLMSSLTLHLNFQQRLQQPQYSGSRVQAAFDLDREIAMEIMDDIVDDEGKLGRWAEDTSSQSSTNWRDDEPTSDQEDELYTAMEGLATIMQAYSVQDVRRVVLAYCLDLLALELEDAGDLTDLVNAFGN